LTTDVIPEDVLAYLDTTEHDALVDVLARPMLGHPCLAEGRRLDSRRIPESTAALDILIARGLAEAWPPESAPAADDATTLKIADTPEPESDGDWEAPFLDASLPPEPFPLEVLPTGLSNLVRQVAGCIPCSPDLVAVPALAIAGGAIGRSAVLAIKDSWVEPPLLYAVVVSSPGEAKSPALRIVARPLWKLEAELMDGYQVAKEAARLRRKALEAERKAKGSRPSLDDEPDPVLRRIVMINATVESIGPILAENPRGMIKLHDELSAWINSMNQYKGGSGDDLQFWLSNWSCSPILIDRVRNEGRVPVRVPHPFLAVAGAIPPDALRGTLDDQPDDGFIDRILFAYPAEVKRRWSWESAIEGPSAAWERAFRRLWEFPQFRPKLRERDKESVYEEERPHFVGLTEPALREFAAWYDEHCAEAEQPDFPRHLKGPWAKYLGYCGRLALILDRLRWAYGNEPIPAHPNVGPPPIGVESIRGAIRLVGYFKAHFRRVASMMRCSDLDNPDARAVLDWAIKSKGGMFTFREARDNFRRRFADRPEDLPACLTWLQSRACIRPKAPAAPRVTGRLPTTSYEINPALLPPGKRAQNAQNAEGIEGQ
jgi:hypothetical protein